MKILITGSNGFLGSNICRILSKNHEVIALSRKFHSINFSNVTKVAFDMTDFETLEKTFKEHQPDYVIHCAWIGANSSKEVNELWQIDNINLSSNILKLCQKYNVKNFMGIGSSSEFGDCKTKFNENSFCKPHNMYGISKYAFKLISENFCHQNNINYVWVRPVFTYGPNDVETRLVPKTIISFLNNQNLKLNSCQTVVDYLYIDDFCSGIEEILNNNITGNVIISSNQETQVKSLVETIYNKISPNSELIFDPSLDDKTPKYICGTSEKLLRLTKWKPNISLDLGLDNTIKFFKAKL